MATLWGLFMISSEGSATAARVVSDEWMGSLSQGPGVVASGGFLPLPMRSDHRPLWLWAAAGIAGAVALVWAYPKVFPFRPQPWELSRAEARAIALERLRDLGAPVARAYVVTHLENEEGIELRLENAAPAAGREALRRSPLAERVTAWEVVVYPPGARVPEWNYRATLALSGKVLAMRRRVRQETPGAAIDPASARVQAD